MEMHKVEYVLNLTGSKLFDMVMYNTAKELCYHYPGLDLHYEGDTITVRGELNDHWYEKYQEEMFGGEQQG